MEGNERFKKVLEIAHDIAHKGGRAFFVGGYVRDYLLGQENDDFDIEVHQIKEEDLIHILEKHGQVDFKGKQFGIFVLKDFDIDIALPRIEKKVGEGHCDFEITVDPFLDYKEACKRRDFTINAILMDVITSEVIDPFDGINDLKNKTIRCVDKNGFIEDPLRVLRACQFSARTGFEIEDGTLSLMKGMDISSLSKAKVYNELKKASLKSQKPSIFFENLRKIEKLDYWFKELYDLIGVEQNPVYHPEGDAYVHTLECLDRAVKYKEKSNNPFAFMLLALCHDFGKAVSSTNEDGVIHSIGHEKTGCPLALDFIKRLGGDKNTADYLNNMIYLHMRPNVIENDSSSLKASNRMFEAATDPIGLIYFSVVDKDFGEDNSKRIDDLLNRYSVYLSSTK